MSGAKERMIKLSKTQLRGILSEVALSTSLTSLVQKSGLDKAVQTMYNELLAGLNGAADEVERLLRKAVYDCVVRCIDDNREEGNSQIRSIS